MATPAPVACAGAPGTRACHRQVDGSTRPSHVNRAGRERRGKPENSMRNRIPVLVAVTAALLAHASIASADIALQPSPLALNLLDLVQAARAQTTQALDAAATLPQAMLMQQGSPNLPSLPNVEAAAVAYRPRTQNTFKEENSRPIVTQMHGGYF